MRYLNTTTLKQTQVYLDSTTVIDTDPKVSNWFSNVPVGHKGEWVGDTYTFIEIPSLNTDGSVNTQGFECELLETKESGEYYEFYNTDGTPDTAKIDAGLLEDSQAEFRTERNALLASVDIEINIAFDSGLSTAALSEYRVALRDSTITWVLPEQPIT